MLAAEKFAFLFEPVTDDMNTAISASRSERMDRALKTVIGQLKPGLPRSGRSDRPRYSFPIARTVMQRLRLSDRSSLIRLGFTTCSATSRNSSRTAMSSISESCRRMVAPWRKKTVSTTQSAAETFGSIHGKSVRRTALQSIKLLVCAISASGSSEQLPLEDPQRSSRIKPTRQRLSPVRKGRQALPSWPGLVLRLSKEMQQLR